ncbi:MAG: amphi-Trp domain-containing protein [Candidatus Moranbacteria bacterium]|nr:amphi-Trp domain-containing protein [Candidatus Moranbacteria bacterium]
MEKKYSKKMYIAKMKRFIAALEKGRPFSIQVKGKKIRIPAEAEISIEFEKDERNELEFQIKW